MQLTKHTDFAFRTLIYLSMMQEELTTIQKITDSFGISKTHAMKIVNTLANKGWVQSIRGRNGGIKLGCDPREIKLDEVVILMENTLDPVNCDQPPCLIAGACVLKSELLTAQQAYLDHLATLSLADLANKRTQQRINNIPIAQEPMS
ncbi:hypothetical protein A9Q79_00065 [Methylophaga sp. 42_25_T18]|nr:hypothetical protein A9Q79_00065 [Methylophaga sp. 42_25_T18]OUR85586.1 hypothetical protein A9Q92_07840 [Methylophaga sp. 42_8_T64]